MAQSRLASTSKCPLRDDLFGPAVLCAQSLLRSLFPALLIETDDEVELGANLRLLSGSSYRLDNICYILCATCCKTIDCMLYVIGYLLKTVCTASYILFSTVQYSAVPYSTVYQCYWNYYYYYYYYYYY